MDTLAQQRLTSVLSAPYADPQIREALQILDKQFVENTAGSRRQLRTSVQSDVIESNARVLEDFAIISERLAQIGSALQSMSDVVSSMRMKNTSAVAETAPMLEESAQLLVQKVDIAGKDLLLSAFLARFTATEENTAVLTSSIEPVDDKFFAALRKIKRIHRDCQVLLASGNERVGTETMDEMGKHLNAAFQKLFLWVQRELKTLSLESPQVNSGIRGALRVLAERPALFQKCLDFFAEARQKIILDSFYTALTGASRDATTNVQLTHSTKPIELYAHDPLRYIGDILAWLHSAAVGEQEALEVMFITAEGSGDAEKSILGGLQEGYRNSPWANDEVAAGEEVDWDMMSSLLALVDKNLELARKPLQTRIEQAIASQESSTLSYKLANLINFYRVTFEKLLGSQSGLLQTIKSVEDTALRQFYSTIDDHARSVKLDLSSPPQDLTPPQFLAESLKDLSQLMNSYSTSLAPNEAREEEFSNILEHALNPYLEGCDLLARDLPKADQHIFSLNCLVASRSALEAFDFTARRLSQLDKWISYHSDGLIDCEYKRLLERSGMRDLVSAFSTWELGKSKLLSQVQAFSGPSLQAIVIGIDEFLPLALMDARSDLRRLRSPCILDEVVHQAASRFIDDFARIEEAVMTILGTEIDGGMEYARVLWPRTVEEVRVLLS